jgi:hypothetical protein
VSILSTTKQGLVRFSILASLAALPFGAEAQDDRRKAQFDNRLGSVKALSTALSSDPGAARPEVKATMAKVAARQKEAEELAAVGEYDTARLILDEGYAELTKTLVSLKGGSGYSGPSGAAAAGGGQDKSRALAAFDRDLTSAKAMLDALKRQNQDKRAGKDALIGDIEARLRQAETQRNTDIAAADRMLDGAYETTKQTIQSLNPSAAPASSSVADRGEKDKAQLVAAFDRELMGAKAILDALKRQNQEKRAGKDAEIQDIETRLRQAETLRGVDIVAADKLLDDAYAQTKQALQSVNVSGAQTASAAASGAASGGASAAAGAEAQRAETDRILKSSALLREAVLRLSKEKGADSAATVSRIDTLSAESRSRQASDPARALQAATEANQTAKDALAKLR